MSILSMFEIIFWIGRLMGRIIHAKLLLILVLIKKMFSRANPTDILPLEENNVSNLESLNNDNATGILYNSCSI